MRNPILAVGDRVQVSRVGYIQLQPNAKDIVCKVVSILDEDFQFYCVVSNEVLVHPGSRRRAVQVSIPIGYTKAAQEGRLVWVSRLDKECTYFACSSLSKEEQIIQKIYELYSRNKHTKHWVPNVT